MSDVFHQPGGGRVVFLTEAMVFTGHMVVTRTVKFHSPRRGVRRTVAFRRRFDWPARELTDDTLRVDAETALAGMGWQPCQGGWWYLEAGERPEHCYALLERVPGSSAGWRD